MKNIQIMRTVFKLLLLSVILSTNCYAREGYETIVKLREITESTPLLNAHERVTKCIDLLKYEIANPSEPIFDLSTGKCDTMGVRAAIALSVCTFAQRGKLQLEIRDEVKRYISLTDLKDKDMHKYLIFMLASTGDESAKDDLMNIIKTETNNSSRIIAITALRDISKYLNNTDINYLKSELLKENNIAYILFSDSMNRYEKSYIVCSGLKSTIAMVLRSNRIIIPEKDIIIDDKYGIQLLEQMLYSDIPNVEEVINVIKMIGGPEAEAALTKFIKSKSRDITAANKALEIIKAKK